MRDHAIDVKSRVACSLGPKVLKHIAIFGFQGLLASLRDHPTLNPHFGPFGHGKVRAFRNVERCDLRVAGAQAFVEEWLRKLASRSLSLKRSVRTHLPADRALPRLTELFQFPPVPSDNQRP